MSGYLGFVPKEAGKKVLTFYSYHRGVNILLISAFSTEKHISSNNLQVEIQRKKYLLAQNPARCNSAGVTGLRAVCGSHGEHPSMTPYLQAAYYRLREYHFIFKLALSSHFNAQRRRRGIFVWKKHSFSSAVTGPLAFRAVYLTHHYKLIFIWQNTLSCRL